MIKAKRLSLLQSFSAGSSSRNPPDVTKSRSSLSNTTNESDTDIEHDQTDFSWAQSLSDDDDERPKRRRHKYLPPPPTNPHMQWFAHGLMWTCLAIAFGWMGVGFSYAARQSTHFVATKEPMYLDPRYETIPAIGMIQMELCFNQTHLDILEELNDNGFLLEPGLELGAQPRTRTVDSAPEYDDDDDIGPSVVDLATTSCIIHRLTSDDVHDDVLYQLSRSMAFLSILLGGFITACLTLSAIWKTINLRPIGAGFLVAYFMQSFTFLIFDSNLCKDNMGCKMSRGGAYSVVASICWIVACAACARMEKKKIKIEGEEEAEMEEMRRQRRKLERSIEHQVRPQHIVAEKEIQPKSFEDTEERRIRRKKPHHEHDRPLKPKRIAKEHRASTAETAIISDDEDSDAISEDNQKILQDLKKLNQDPIYIPSLPESSPNSERSMRKADQKSSSKHSVTNERKKDLQNEEKSTKARSKKAKSKSKKFKTQNILEDLNVAESSSTNDEETEKPQNRKPKGATKSQQERSRSPSKSIDMAGDVVDTILAEKIKSSTRVNDRKPNENNSTRSRRSRSNPRPRSSEMRASLQKSIEEGKHYEL